MQDSPSSNEILNFFKNYIPLYQIKKSNFHYLKNVGTAESVIGSCSVMIVIFIMQSVKKVEKKQSQESTLNDDIISIQTKHGLVMTETNVNMGSSSIFPKHSPNSIKLYYARRHSKTSSAHTPTSRTMQCIPIILQIFLTHILFLSPIELRNPATVRPAESPIIFLIVLAVLIANIATSVLFLKIFTVVYIVNLVVTVTAVSGQVVVLVVMTALDVLI
jgi:hypothetical protein